MTDERTTSRRRPLRDALRLGAVGLTAFLLLSCHLTSSVPLLALGDPAPGQLLDGTDVTFYITADTHLGHEGIREANLRQVDALNALPGTPWPDSRDGTVDEPRGVLIAGDLTDDGAPGEWDEFEEIYGLDGTDGLLKWPVFEATGNHDRRILWTDPVLGQVARRHGRLVRSWNWDDVHMVSLDLYPDYAARQWLARDLARAGRKVPVVIYFHYAIQGPWSQWWGDSEKEAFAEVIDGYNVVAIFHGHSHRPRHYRWKGYDVFNVGACRHRHYSFCAVRITDETITVASRQWDEGRWRSHFRKPIRGASASSASRVAGAAPLVPVDR